MRLVVSLVSLLGSAAVVLGGSQHHRWAPLTVKTSSGVLTGFVNDTAPDVRQWLGVPYAEPPVGELRFMPPVRKRFAGALTTTAFQPSCMQQTSTAKTVYTEYMQQFLINGGWSEDCLYINVYAPRSPSSASLPVFIYIPGGGFTGGGSNSAYKIPDKWVQHTQSHIVITINYRLNLFGFPNARGAPQNAGLLDQRLVVEWARDNIAGFGGNPEKMILWGQSAGSASVGMYGYAYPQDPIVKGLISDSGAAAMLTKNDPTHSVFTTFAGFVGCGNLTAEAELRCMQAVDATTLQTTLSSGTTGASFTPSGDNITAFTNTTDRISHGLISKLPMIMGFNANEGAGFGTFSPNGLTPGQYQIGLAAIVCPVVKEVQNRENAGLTTYRYYYTGNFSNISPLPWIGATHSAELPLLFGTHYEFRGNSTQFEWEVSYTMQDLWLSFANKPSTNPYKGSFVWPRYNSSTSSMAVFAANNTVVQLESQVLVDGQCS